MDTLCPFCGTNASAHTEEYCYEYLLDAHSRLEAKVAEYERIFAEIWGNAMTDCGPYDYSLFPQMLRLHDEQLKARINYLEHTGA